MPLETGTYISDLIVTNPAHTDGLNNADAHARLIKSTLKTTFPNITGAVTATQADLNNLAAQLTGGVSILADTGVFFKTNTTDGFTNPAAGEIDLKLAGVIGGTFIRSGGVNTFTWNGNVHATGNATIDGNATVGGTLAVTGAITGPGTVPIGGMIMWLDDTLPADGGGVAWCWANGGTLSRTGNGAALFAKWGTRYGAGDGSTTFNVINMQEAVPVGKSTMGGATSPGLLASISSGVKAVLNGLFGSDTSTLATTNLPPYTPVGTVATTTSCTNANSGFNFPASPGPGNVGVGGTANGGDLRTPTYSSVSTFTGTAQGGTSTPFGNLPPSRVVNFIIRIA